MKTVRAKFVCQSLTQTSYGTKAEFSAVHSATGENADFADATPSGKVEVFINKGRPAAEAFEPGKSYYLDFTPAEG